QIIQARIPGRIPSPNNGAARVEIRKKLDEKISVAFERLRLSETDPMFLGPLREAIKNVFEKELLQAARRRKKQVEGNGNQVESERRTDHTDNEEMEEAMDSHESFFYVPDE